LIYLDFVQRPATCFWKDENQEIKPLTRLQSNR